MSLGLMGSGCGSTGDEPPERRVTTTDSVLAESLRASLNRVPIDIELLPRSEPGLILGTASVGQRKTGFELRVFAHDQDATVRVLTTQKVRNVMGDLLGPQTKPTVRGVLNNLAYAEYDSELRRPQEDVTRSAGQLLEIRRSVDNVVYEVMGLKER